MCGTLSVMAHAQEQMRAIYELLTEQSIIETICNSFMSKPIKK